MIQDIAPHVYHNEYRPVPPDEDSFVLIFEEGRILLKKEEGENEIRFLLNGRGVYQWSYLRFLICPSLPM